MSALCLIYSVCEMQCRSKADGLQSVKSNLLEDFRCAILQCEADHEKVLIHYKYIRLALQSAKQAFCMGWGKDSSVSKKPYWQSIDRRSEPHCRHGVSLVWAFSNPPPPLLRIASIGWITTVNNWRSQSVDKGQHHSTVV